jgi:type IX secretion system PorP/SprF family membrane protein
VGLSQDVHFSQSFHGPILLNPAWTGNYFGDWRFVQNYRQQWSQIGKPLSTIGMGMDRQFYVFRHKISAGIQIVHDESGDFRLIHQKLLGSIAYHHSVGRNEFHFGVQGGYVSKRLDFTGISLPDQFDINSGLFNASLQTREANLNNREAYADCNVGIGFSRRFARFKPEIGLALYHVNQPNESFNYDINYLAVREVIHLNAYIHLNDRYALEPRIIYMSQRKSRDLVFGTLGYMQLAKNFARAEQAFTGLYLRDGVTRNWDAFVLLLGLQFKQFRTTMSYDITVSKLRLANSYQGALEFSLIFTGVSSVLSKRAIPCRRM